MKTIENNAESVMEIYTIGLWREPNDNCLAAESMDDLTTELKLI